MASFLKIFQEPILVILAFLILVLVVLGIFARWQFGPDDSLVDGIMALVMLFAGGFTTAIKQAVDEPEKPADG